MRVDARRRRGAGNAPIEVLEGRALRLSHESKVRESKVGARGCGVVAVTESVVAPGGACAEFGFKRGKEGTLSNAAREHPDICLRATTPGT